MKKISIAVETATSKPISIIERIRTFEDACKVIGISGEVFTANLHELLAEDANAIEAHTKLLIISKALNEGWTPDWSDDEEYKYYPWWDMEEGFVLDGVNCDYTLTSVSSRLCFKSRDLAEYAAKQFIDLYKQYFIINK